MSGITQQASESVPKGVDWTPPQCRGPQGPLIVRTCIAPKTLGQADEFMCLDNRQFSLKKVCIILFEGNIFSRIQIIVNFFEVVQLSNFERIEVVFCSYASARPCCVIFFCFGSITRKVHGSGGRSQEQSFTKAIF